MGGYGWWAEPIGELRGWPQTPNTRRDIPRISGDAQCSPFRSHQAGRGGAPATALVGVLPRGARRREIVRGGLCGVAGCGAAAVHRSGWASCIHSPGHQAAVPAGLAAARVVQAGPSGIFLRPYS